MTFNWVDVIFVTILIRTSYIGLKNGFLPEFFRLLGLVIAFILSINYYTVFSQFLAAHIKWGGARLELIAFLCIWVLVLLLFKTLSLCASLLIRGDHFFIFTRLLGLPLGFIRGIILVSLVYTLFINSPFDYLASSAKERAVSGRYVSRISPLIYKGMTKCYPFVKIDTPVVKLLESLQGQE